MAILHADLPEGLHAALRQVNTVRDSNDDASPPSLPLLESLLDNLFNTGRHLAIYGSLAPGEPNHAVVESIQGEWLNGMVRGKLHDLGWGSSAGYPGMTWDPEGDEIPIKVLKSRQLGDHWERLDAFEGPGYHRILIPVETTSGDLLIANIYEVRRGR